MNIEPKYVGYTLIPFVVTVVLFFFCLCLWSKAKWGWTMLVGLFFIIDLVILFVTLIVRIFLDRPIDWVSLSWIVFSFEGILSSFLLFYVKEHPKKTIKEILEGHINDNYIPKPSILFSSSERYEYYTITILLNLTNIIILLIYSISYYFDDHSSVGFFHSAYIHIIDVSLQIINNNYSLVSPFLSSIILFLSHISVFLFGEKYWFIGHSLSFVLLIILFSFISFKDLSEKGTEEERDAAKKIVDNLKKMSVNNNNNNKCY